MWIGPWTLSIGGVLRGAENGCETWDDAGSQPVSRLVAVITTCSTERVSVENKRGLPLTQSVAFHLDPTDWLARGPCHCRLSLCRLNHDLSLGVVLVMHALV